MPASVTMDAELKMNLAAMKGMDSVTVYIGTNLTDPPYPFFLEYGTSRMFAQGSGRRAFELAQDPALRTASRILADQFRQKRFRTESLHVAGEAGGLDIANRWKELAPVRTGTYQESIHVETETTP